MEPGKCLFRSLVCCLSVLASSMFTASTATAVDMTVPELTGKLGDRISVPVNISNATGLGIIGVELTLTYNASILTAISVSISESVLSSSGWMNPIYSISDGQVIIWVADFDELVGEGTLVRVSFNVSESASKGDSTQLNLTDVYLNEGNVPVTIDNGSFSVISNTAPVSNGQAVATNEDTSIGITLTGSDVDGDPLTYHVVDEPSNGSLAGTAPNLTYTPELNFNGSDSFTFKVNDGSIDSNIATVIITVNPVNDPPVAYDQSILTDEDTPIDITLTGSDVEGDPLIYHVVDDPSYGSLTGAAPNLIYTPNPDFKGSDSFSFEVNDGNADSDPATVSIIVGSVFFSCTLEQSWNLISLPLEPTDTDPGVVLSSIDTKYNSVWAYDPNEGWSIYAPGAPSDLEEMIPGRGYWIKMDVSGTLTIEGTIPERTAIPLTGNAWNLVGYNSLESRNAGECMSSVASDINSVWEYGPHDAVVKSWSIYAPGAPSDLEVMKPGYGYWIKADENCEWDVNSTAP